MPSRACETCGRMSWACACHVSFKDKVAGLTISQDAMPNRTKVRWWDDEVINSQFGGTPAERREQYMEETKGLGHVQADGSGRLWHKDRKDGEVKPLSEAQAVDAVGGPA